MTDVKLNFSVHLRILLEFNICYKYMFQGKTSASMELNLHVVLVFGGIRREGKVNYDKSMEL